MSEIESAPTLSVDEEPPVGPEPEAVASPSEPAASAPDLASLVAAGFAEVLAELRDRHAHDRFKESQIDQLHRELQGYKNDATSRPVRELLLGVIRLHDDLGKTRAALWQKPPEELTPELFFRQLDELRDDLELLLGQHGVEPFEAPGDGFDPHRQTALRTVPATDSGQVGRLAERLRPGFEQGDRLLQKERVAVYVTSNSEAPKSAPASPSGGAA